MATAYHLILFLHRRDRLIRDYCFYLFALLIYLVFRFVAGRQDSFYWKAAGLHIATDGTLLMLSYFAYIKFWGTAFQVSRNDGPFVWRFYKSCFPLIVIYIIWESLTWNVEVGMAYDIAYAGVRIYIAFVGLVALYFVLKKRSGVYFRYLAGGSVVIVAFGMLSFMLHLLSKEEPLWGVTAFGWIMFGSFLDVVFFSAAVGYRLKIESIEREEAMRKILAQQQIIQKKELEKVEAAFLAKEEERNRISQELHDDLGGGLSTIQLMTQMIANPEFELSGNYLQNISAKSKELIQSMGEIVWSLNNGNDTLPGTVAYIRAYAVRFLEEANISVDFRQPADLPDEVIDGVARRHIFLLVKEALHNIVKHAKATEASIAVSVDDNLTFRIADNGIGLPETALRSMTGNGLRNINERIKALQGFWKAESHHGTVLIFTVPLQPLYNKSVSRTASTGE